MSDDAMRVVTVPEAVVRRAAYGPYLGTVLEFAVAVDWPELRLTEDQVITNAVARAAGQPEPYPDRSIFTVRVPFLPPESGA